MPAAAAGALVLFCAGVLAGAPAGAQAPRRDAQPAVLAADAARFAAMVRGDLAALDTLLAPDLTYVHTDGTAETKPQFLERLRAGRLRYLEIRPTDRRVREYPPLALVTGRSAMRARSEGRVLRFDIRFTAVYRRMDGRWALVAWQATRLPAPRPRAAGRRLVRRPPNPSPRHAAAFRAIFPRTARRQPWSLGSAS